MRIAGGAFRGRTLLVPRSAEIRPTQDRVREALFSILQTEVPGAEFLDLFAGTGAVGLEALSRGAASATFVESARAHLETLRRNVEAMAGGLAANIVAADVFRYVSTYRGAGFSIAFADPPYAMSRESGGAELMGAMAGRGVVRPGGLFVSETARGAALPEAAGWTLLRDRTYGKTRLCVWRRDEGAG